MKCFGEANWRFVLVCMTVVSALPALAADFQRIESDFCTLRLRGEIQAGDTDKLQSFLTARKPPRRICLDSPGGSYDEGLKLAALVTATPMGTMIEAGAKCLSACAVVFMARIESTETELPLVFGDPDRLLHVRGKLGFHAPPLSLSARKKKTYEWREIIAAYNTSLSEIGRLAGRQYTNIRASLLAELLRSGSREIFYLDTVRKAARWQIELVGYSIPQDITDGSFANACLNHFYQSNDVWHKPFCGQGQNCLENRRELKQAQPVEQRRGTVSWEYEETMTHDAGVAEICAVQLSWPVAKESNRSTIGTVGFYLVNEDTKTRVTKSEKRIPAWFLFSPEASLHTLGSKHDSSR